MLGTYILNRADNVNVVGTEGIFILQFLCRRFLVSFYRGLTYYAHVVSSVRQSTDAQVFIDATANYLSSAQLTQTMAYDV